MPQCCCGSRCTAPELPDSKHHRCPGCKKSIHAICGEQDTSRGILYSNMCFDCADLSSGGSKKPKATVATEREAVMEKEASNSAPPVKKPVAKKKKSATSRLPSKIKFPGPPPPKKGEEPIADFFVGKKVAFSVQGKNKPSWLDENKYSQYAEMIGTELYLLGTVTKKLGRKADNSYNVEWNNSMMAGSKLESGVLYEARYLADSLARDQMGGQTRKLRLDTKIISALTTVIDDHEKGNPIVSDAEDEDDDDADEFRGSIETVDELKKKKWKALDEFSFPSLVSPNNTNGIKEDGLIWNMSSTQSAPVNVGGGRRTKIKETAKIKFVTPLSSFLALLPIEFWKLYVFQTNNYAHWKIAKEEKEGKSQQRVWKDVTLNEFMTFFGILMMMTVRPTPGLTYTECWNYPGWHPYTAYMDKSRFVAIRTVLHMSVKGVKEENSNDALYKVRPIVNTLKKTMGAYVDPGDDLALDESSVASRTSYGRHLLVFNKDKPCGKYHFKFYVVCDADFYTCLRFRVHTKNDSDEGDGLPIHSREVVADYVTDEEKDKNSEDEIGEGNEEEEDEGFKGPQTGKLVRLVADMCKPWYNTGRVVNMDNYYTSPAAFIELRNNGLFARGTCRSDRRMFPKTVLFTKPEAKKVGRGGMKLATNTSNGLVAIGWVDGNPVHFLTSADGTKESSVQRKVNNKSQTVKAPTAIMNYNHGMQAVDRFDQLMSLFSLAQRHAFKKYYNKLTMGLMDFALVNAEIHHYLVHPDKKKKRNHRYEFRCQLAQALFDTEWDTFEEDDTFAAERRQDKEYSTTTKRQATSENYLCEKERINKGFEMAPTVDITSLRGEDVADCNPVTVAAFLRRNNTNKTGLTYGGAYCQVCEYEGRPKVTRHVVICNHGVRACVVVRSSKGETDLANKIASGDPDETKTWLCQNLGAVHCFEKLHQYYIPRGLFGSHPTIKKDKNGCPRTQVLCSSSTLYKARTHWMVKNEILKKAPGKRGPSKGYKKTNRDDEAKEVEKRSKRTREDNKEKKDNGRKRTRQDFKKDKEKRRGIANRTRQNWKKKDTDDDEYSDEEIGLTARI